MKHFFSLLSLLFCALAMAQTTEDKKTVTLSFSDQTIKEAIIQLESVTNHIFYFEDAWLELPDKITAQYTNTPISAIVTDLLKNTNLNFYVTGNKIILIPNTIVYDTLPENFFSTDLQKESGTELMYEAPLFYKDQEKETLPENSITLIGKEEKNSTKKMMELSGYVKADKNGKPVAEVIVKTSDGKYNAVTDSEGYFSLMLPPGINNIETESFLYKKAIRKIRLYSNGKLNFTLSENINQLQEIIVKGKKTETLKSANTGVTSINIEGIKNIPMVLGERDILKAATITPGIKTAGEGAAGFNVRGGKTDQNLILLDDGVIYNPAHFFGFFSGINPYTIESADIYKGSIPAEYGGRLSSVFNIVSKKGNTAKVAGEGGIGPVTSNLMVSTPLVKDKSSLLLGARATYSDWILKTLDEKSLKNSKASFYDGILKYHHNFNENNTVEATGYYSHDAFSVSSDSLYKYSNRLFSVKWNHTFNPKHKASLSITNSLYDFKIEYEKEEEMTKSFDFGYKINDTQLQLKFNYAPNDKHKISYGLSTKFYNIKPGDLTPTGEETLLVPLSVEREKASENGIYIADSFKISDDLLLSAGLRYSFYAALGSGSQTVYANNLPISEATAIEEKHYSNYEIIKSYGGLEPRVSARYFITDDLSVKASYDKTYQYLHLLSSNTTQSPTDTWKLSDLNIKPQSADQFSIGFYKNFSQKGIEVSLEGYTKKIRNILDYKVGADLLLNDHIETELLSGEGKAYGIEFLLKKESGRLNGWLGYTYSRTFIKLDSEFESNKVNNGDYFPANYDKPHDISAIMNYRLTKRYSISTNFIYQTGRPITYPIGKYMYGGSEYTLYSDRNQYRIPDYYRLDIGINIEGNHKLKKLAHSFWNVSVYNVLGRNNPYSVFFVTKEGEVKAYKTTIFSVPVPTISYNFKF